MSESPRKVVPQGRATHANEKDRLSTDEALLGQFLDGAGAAADAAFEALVLRYSSMVYGVCRKVLDRHQDAEDAYQLTFLSLARKAGTIRDRNSLGCWLHEVAARTAARAKAREFRRRSREMRWRSPSSATIPDDGLDLKELRTLLRNEVNRLPEKYRTLVVLCYLEGKSNEDVARLLECPVGTVKGRLSRARLLLRARLLRRGVGPPAAFVVNPRSTDQTSAAG